MADVINTSDAAIVNNGAKRGTTPAKRTETPAISIAPLGKETNCAGGYAQSDATVKVPAGTFVIFVDMEAESSYETKGGRKYIAKVNGQKTIGDVPCNIGFFITEASQRNSLD